MAKKKSEHDKLCEYLLARGTHREFITKPLSKRELTRRLIRKIVPEALVRH